jgi:hypothetical protein
VLLDGGDAAAAAAIALGGKRIAELLA